jgi:hypothetical protein
LALFYLEPHLTAGDQQPLRTGTRLWPDLPEAADLAGLLRGVVILAAEAFRAGWREAPAAPAVPFDAYEHLTTNRDPISPAAVFFGVGACTLNTPAGTWQDTKRDAESALGIPGCGYIYLVDGTHMLIDRSLIATYEQVTVRCSASDTNAFEGAAGMRWRLDAGLGEQAPEDPEWWIWRGLEDLTRVIYHGASQ